MAAAPLAAPPAAPLRKVRDLVLYEDATYYAAFPSVVRRPDGELIVAFRRAPARVAFGELKESHVDPNSYLVQVRSRDDGATSWRLCARRASTTTRFSPVRRMAGKVLRLIKQAHFGVLRVAAQPRVRLIVGRRPAHRPLCPVACFRFGRFASVFPL